jgi:hypothetical protein
MGGGELPFRPVGFKKNIPNQSTDTGNTLYLNRRP